ncbi:MAG: DUF4129 domain-containing protein [Bacteroidetes bacterium]|nr:DUF4129 domain-containing protein [Bacteroidota bacterium]
MANRFLKLLLLCLAGLGAVHFSWSQDVYDSSRFNSSRVGLKGAEPIDGIYVPTEDSSLLNQAAPTPSQWKELSCGPEFAYRNRLEYVPKAIPKEETTWMEKILDEVSQFLDSRGGKNLLWLIFFGILGYIGWRVFSGQAHALFARRDKKYVNEEEAEDLSVAGLLENNWEDRMQDALQAGASREAIRFAYLYLLQRMQQVGLLSFRPDKTNRAYIEELKGKPQVTVFRKLTEQYEQSWYGRMKPDENQMAAFLEQFRKVKNSIEEA